VIQLRVRVKGIVHDGDGADLEDCKIRHDTGNRVRQEKGHGIAFPDPEIRQAGGEPVHHVFHLPE